MDIIGTGMDATEIDRVQAMIDRYGDRFLRRVYTEGEIAYCQRKRNSAESFAARFAAKEAAMKALGTGHTQGVIWKSVEVVRGAGGPPSLALHDAALRRMQWMGGTRAVLTLTHSGPLNIALAHVLLLKD